MKKCILFILCTLLCSIQVYAQKQVTTFLGIPVDGTKEALTAKLKAKGFTRYDADYLQGIFNGEDVFLGIVVNKNKVRRIVILYRKTRDEQEIKRRYNRLINQFSNNARYVVGRAELLEEEEDISYQIAVKNKTYQATFYQLPVDGNLTQRNVSCRLFKEGSRYRIGIYYDNRLNEAQGEDL